MMILSAVSLLLLSLISCGEEEQEQQNDNPIVHILSKDSDKGDKGSNMPPDD
ncbi:hypothetical protein [Chryseobacterium sp. SL1]|uniref:hypothetical protein n=1 Tax=Chryseobacterium sp. SL1 TaxID=2995159 RepID=UPI0022758B47|nr:hypothetical protein [Chryseobacterium sp. SL1]MCY1660914.1 hypothetical protein [Chryseobacterium sp. SL1]